MRTLEDIRRELADCDHELIHQLMRRMSLVSEIIPVKRESGIPIFQPDVEQSRLALFDGVLENENYRKNSQRNIEKVPCAKQGKDLAALFIG